MGHSSINVTLDRYGQLFPELDEAMAAVVRRAAGSGVAAPERGLMKATAFLRIEWVAFTLPLVHEGHAATLVREARHGSGLSRRALAARAGVPTSTVSRVETGEIDPTVGMLRRIIDAAGSRLVMTLEAGDAEPTLASLAHAVEHVGARLKIDWTRLRRFADWAAEHPDRLAPALVEPPARTGTPLDAILAAFAEELAVEHGLPRPRWTRAVGPLAEEWVAPGTPRMRAEAAAKTPEPFRRRNLVLARSALFRQAA